MQLSKQGSERSSSKLCLVQTRGGSNKKFIIIFSLALLSEKVYFNSSGQDHLHQNLSRARNENSDSRNLPSGLLNHNLSSRAKQSVPENKEWQSVQG